MLYHLFLIIKPVPTEEKKVSSTYRGHILIITWSLPRMFYNRNQNNHSDNTFWIFSHLSSTYLEEYICYMTKQKRNKVASLVFFQQVKWCTKNMVNNNYDRSINVLSTALYFGKASQLPCTLLCTSDWKEANNALLSMKGSLVKFSNYSPASCTKI